MKVWNRMSTFAVGCVLLAGCGANGPEPAEPITEQEQQEGETVETGGVVATLPPRAVDGSGCIETPTTPALCDWLHSTDGLYFGELKALELTATPAVSAHGGETFVTCTTEIANHNLRIVLEVDESGLSARKLLCSSVRISSTSGACGQCATSKVRSRGLVMVRDCRLAIALASRFTKGPTACWGCSVSR